MRGCVKENAMTLGGRTSTMYHASILPMSINYKNSRRIEDAGGSTP